MILRACMTCERYFAPDNPIQARCQDCLDLYHVGKLVVGNIIVKGAPEDEDEEEDEEEEVEEKEIPLFEKGRTPKAPSKKLGPVTTRQLSLFKEQVYKVESTLMALDDRLDMLKAEYQQIADKIRAEWEKQHKITEDQARRLRTAMRAKLHILMRELGENRLQIKDLIYHLKSEIRGGRPRPLEVYKILARLAKINSDQLEEIKASTATLREVEKLEVERIPKPAPAGETPEAPSKEAPPAEEAKPTESEEDVEPLVGEEPKSSLPPTPKIKKDIPWARWRTYSFKRGGENFILSRDKIVKHGLDNMVALQKQYKQSLTIERREGNFLALRGLAADDVNTVLAFIRDKFPGHYVVGMAFATHPTDHSQKVVGVEMRKAVDEAAQLESLIQSFTDSLDRMIALERQKGQVVEQLAEQIGYEPEGLQMAAASPADPGIDNVEDFEAMEGRLPTRQRHQEWPTSEGIMAPDGGAPVTSSPGGAGGPPDYVALSNRHVVKNG